MEYLRLQLNVPAKIALAYPDGIRKEGLYGPEMFYSLADGRGLYLPEAAAQKIQTANIQPGQTFWLCKRKVAGSAKNRKNMWDLYTEDPTCQPIEESPLERDLRRSLEMAEAKAKPQPLRQPEPAPIRALPEPRRTEVLRKPPAWAETLTAQTNELVDCYAECLNHAAVHGLQIRPDDVRTLLVTSFISLSQRGKGRSAA